MKKVILISLVFVSLGVGLGLVYFAPFHYYITAIREGLESELLTVDRAPAHLIRGSEYQLDRGQEYYRDDDSRWKVFHFSHFEIPVPVFHPVYLLRPEIEYDEYEDTSTFGFSFINQRSEVFARVMVHEPIDFHFELGRDQLFNLPYFKNDILNRVPTDVWEDLFLKDILIDSDKSHSFYESYQRVRELPVREMVYNLFILRNRKRLLEDHFDELKFYRQGNMGVLSTEMVPDNEQFGRDILYVFRRGVIYPLELQTLRYSPEAESYRLRLLEALNYKETSTDASIPIYALYRQLDYESRTGHEGMVYLYMAWSHVPEKKQFLREMIRFVERSKQRDMFIRPLYDYAYRKFGTTFSQTDQLRETAEQRLQRMMQEELSDEIERERNRSIDIPGRRFENVEKRMEFYLQRAKEQGFDDSPSRNMLIMD